MKRFRVAIIGIIAIGGCAILIYFVPAILWILFINNMFTKVPDSALNPPVYPNAQQVRIEDKENDLKVISFQTDKPEGVLKFYDDVLLKDRWVHPLQDNGYPKNVFQWRQAGPDGPTDTAYKLMVNFTRIDSKQTRVEITILRYDPR